MVFEKMYINLKKNMSHNITLALAILKFFTPTQGSKIRYAMYNKIKNITDQYSRNVVNENITNRLVYCIVCFAAIITTFQGLCHT